MRTLCLLAATFAAALVSSACGDDQSGVPQPVPIPKEFLMRGTVGLDVDAIRLVGLPGAVIGVGNVTLDGGVGEVIARATDAGSFVARVPCAGRSIEVRFEGSEPASYSIGTRLGGPPIVPVESTMVSPISTPVDGLTTIAGLTDPDLDVFAVNVRSGDVALGGSDRAGAFTLQLPAQRGDQVEVYVNTDPLADAWQLTVP